SMLRPRPAAPLLPYTTIFRSRHAKRLVDQCIQGDLMDTLISRQSFGLLWLNPPYGDLSKDANGNIGYQGQGRPRLEKLFYQKTRSEEHTSELQSRQNLVCRLL